MNDPQPLVIAIYVGGFALAAAVNFYALWILLTDEIGRKRRPEDVPDTVDFPAGPGLGQRRRLPAARNGHSPTSQATEAAAPSSPPAPDSTGPRRSSAARAASSQP